MRSVLSGLLFLHGLIHVVGFVAPLDGLRSAPFETVFFGHKLANESLAARSLAALWLGLAFALSAASVAVFVHARWWFPFTTATLSISLALCVTAWPATKVGAFLNAGLLLTCLVLERGQLWSDLVGLLRVLPF